MSPSQDPKSSWLSTLTGQKTKAGDRKGRPADWEEHTGTLSAEDYPELNLKRAAAEPQATPVASSGAGERLSILVGEGRLRTLGAGEIGAVFQELLARGMLDLFIRSVEQVRSGLESNAPDDRRWGLESVKALIEQEDLSLVPYGTLPLLLDCVGRLLVKEERVELRDAAIETTAQLLGIEGAQGDLESVHAHLAWLERTARARGAEYSSRILASRSLIQRTVDAYFREGQKVLKDRLLPFLQFVGESGARSLVQLLDEEQNRQHRSRILELLKQLGPLSLPALKEGLVAGSWHLVRNALNLVGELEEPQAFEYIVPCLDHADARVVRAAIRALWKTGRDRAERYLLELLPKAEPEIQGEILQGLVQAGTAQSVPAIGALAASGPEELRVQAVETLGQLKLAQALPILEAQVQRKGRIFKKSEPMPVRLAAARALMAIGTQEARRILDQVVKDEPKGADQEAFRRIAGSAGGWR